MSSSCIIKHFEYYSPLSGNDKELLNSLEKGPVDYKRNEALWLQGDSSKHFYTVSKGWAYAYRDMEDGGRQVLDIYVPGDIVGLREFAFKQRITGVVMLTDAELCAFPKTRLTDVFAGSLLLCSILYMIAARDQAILLERVINLGRRSARVRIAHFLVEIAKRLKKTRVDITGRVRVPLTQTLLGDALGLSTVHVNRILSALKREGFLTPYAGGVELRDVPALEEIAGFDSGYLEEDVDGILQHARDTQHRIAGAGHARPEPSHE